MAPTRPTRAAKENGTPTKTADASEAPVKRGRGRPPKNGVAAQPKKAATSTTGTGRPRGRPPGSGGVKKATAKKAAATKATGTGTGRRGRPPKAASAATTPKKAVTPKASSAKKTKGSATKGRKPRKSDAADDDEENEDEMDVEEDDAAAQLEVGILDDDEDDDDVADENPIQSDLGASLENNDTRTRMPGLASLATAWRRISGVGKL
ncbi:hypothetical protein F5Y14DRAFT_330165 [Nemania sp. NC0429]|nr:hypothetical protein F5Y14DRAFT_330165 [Nemania sp. NC0429]